MANVPERRSTESPQAYEAFARYCLLGPQRSHDLVSQELSKSIALMHRWSRTHGWVERCAAYDKAVAQERADVVQEQIRAQYMADLRAHRKKSMDASRGLYTVAGEMLKRIDEALRRQPLVIQAVDGKTYEIPTVDVAPGLIALVKGAFQTSLDLEAHALGIDALIPRLAPADDEE